MHDKYPPIVVSYSIPSRPPTPEPKPTFGTRAYFRSTASRLPPPFQFRFPLNILFYALLPLLIPMGLTAAFIRLSLDSSKSKRRLKLLEKDENFKDRLVHALRRMDKGMENAIAELIEEAGEVEETAAGNAANEAQMEIRSNDKAGPSSSSTTLAKIPGETHLPADAVPASGAPDFSDLQLRIIATLNDLPFNKYAACFPGMFSSHAVIVSRDRQRFAFHAQGEGVLLHWADHFTL
jgi:hypothetical protein